MARGELIATPQAVDASSSLPEDDLHQLRELEKIIHFCSTVISGKHPRVKPPAHLLNASSFSSVPSAGSAALSSSSNITGSQQDSIDGVQRIEENHHAFHTNAQRPAVAMALPGLGSLAAQTTNRLDGPAASKAFGSGSTEIDPIFLTKSDDLIRAELQLQRTRLERALRDQLEQRRNANRALQASETLPEFDLVDVLQRALVLVQNTATPTANTDLAANKDAASDSFDENTFYSSNFDTPDSHQVSRVRNKSEDEDIQMVESSDYEPELDMESRPKEVEPPLSFPPQIQAVHPPQRHLHTSNLVSQSQLYDAPFPNQSSNGSLPGRGVGSLVGLPGIQNGRVMQVISSQESGEASASGESGNTDNEQSTDEHRLQRAAQHSRGANLARPPSPLIRAHDLSPVAPQPARVTPLAASQQMSTVAQDGTLRRGTPAQVAALRKAAPLISSPESSPRNGKTQEKKKKRKNKRKADRQTVDATASPYIKPEPRSPSPMNAPSFVRPHKRQRQGQRPMQDLTYEEPRFAQPANDEYNDSGRDRPPVYRDDRVPVVYERQDDQYARQGAHSVIVQDSPRQVRAVYDDGRHPTGPDYFRRPESPGSYAVRYAPREAMPSRSISHAAVERPSAYGVSLGTAERSYYESQRPSVRPGPDRARSRSPALRARSPLPAGASRMQKPTRIIVDEFGREYLEPARPPSTMIRQSVAPQPRPAEADIIYERIPPPVRAASRMPDTFEEGGVVYRRASPTYAAPRRVVTQPEYVQPDYRGYRQREYSMRSVAGPGEEYTPNRPLPERRMVEEPVREYLPRAASVRPTEPIRYEVARGYGERLGSVRPEASVRKYAASAYPGERVDSGPHPFAVVRREIVEQPGMLREHSVRPERLVQRAFSVHPQEEAYYRGPGRGNEEVTFIERPRGAEQDIAYSHSLRREEFR